MTQKRVLVTDYTWDSTDPEAAVLAEAGAKLIVAKTGEPEELESLVSDADAILTCFKQVPARVLRAGHRLQVVGRYGIGVDNIDVTAATQLGIIVTNVPAYCLDEVAEHAIALILSLARNVPRYDNGTRAGKWDLKAGRPLYRVAGRTLGIVGFGKIGQTLATKAIGLGLAILAYDPFIDAAAARAHHAEACTLEDLLKRSDYISLHTPLTDSTRHLIDESKLRLMKPSAFLVNTSRGGILDQDSLVKALREGWIAGAGLDVFERDRLPDEHPLLSLPNLIATPHVAFYSEESVLELERKAARNVANVLSGQLPESIVNPAVLQLPRWAHLGRGRTESARQG
ncbi:C-terminal binding protein [bacterium]|nr:MAG: C-terminal binding protein [bacterium]